MRWTTPDRTGERVAIVGSREPSAWAKEDVVAQVNALADDATVVTGGANGIDILAEQAARHRGLRVEIHAPDYSMYDGRTAPKVRNTIIAARCDRMIAYTAGSRGGTHDAIRQARRFNRPFTEINR